MRRLLSVALILGACGAPLAPSASAFQPPSGLAARTNPKAQPHELGQIAWVRDLAAGQAEARRTGKPILLLFTEVPGCSTVNGFADAALEHPLLVEATEDLFVPVAIYNNTTGDQDAATRQQFREPSWNNPVVRILDADGKALAPRYASGWTARGYAQTLVKGLQRAGKPVPEYLQNIAKGSASNEASAVFSMYCFWSGEVGLAGLPGVQTTRPGFLGGREVVEVTYDPSVTELDTLARQAAEAGVATGFVARDRAERAAVSPYLKRVIVDESPVRYSASDDKYQLRRTNWRELGLTPEQATALNRAWVTPGEEAAAVLSPRQRSRLR